MRLRCNKKRRKRGRLLVFLGPAVAGWNKWALSTSHSSVYVLHGPLWPHPSPDPLRLAGPSGRRRPSRGWACARPRMPAPRKMGRCTGWSGKPSTPTATSRAPLLGRRRRCCVWCAGNFRSNLSSSLAPTSGRPGRRSRVAPRAAPVRPPRPGGAVPGRGIRAGCAGPRTPRLGGPRRRRPRRRVGS